MKVLAERLRHRGLLPIDTGTDTGGAFFGRGLQGRRRGLRELVGLWDLTPSAPLLLLERFQELKQQLHSTLGESQDRAGGITAALRSLKPFGRRAGRSPLRAGLILGHHEAASWHDTVLANASHVHPQRQILAALYDTTTDNLHLPPPRPDDKDFTNACTWLRELLAAPR